MRIEITTPDGVTQERDLRDTPITLGRSRSCAVPVSDTRTSSRHCILLPHAEGWILADTQSRNGTFRDGERVTKAFLLCGDEFRIGETKVRIAAEGVDAALPPPATAEPAPAPEPQPAKPTAPRAASVGQRMQRSERSALRRAFTTVPAWFLSLGLHVGLVVFLSLFFLAEEKEAPGFVVTLAIAPNRTTTPRIAPPTNSDETRPVWSDPPTAVPHDVELPPIDFDSHMDAVLEDVAIVPDDPMPVGGSVPFVAAHLSGSTPRASGSAVPAGLRGVLRDGTDWLMAHQSEDGSWDTDGFAAHCTDSTCSGPGEKFYDVGVTGLAVLALLGAGVDDPEGMRAAAARRALRYLVCRQTADGCIGPQRGKFLYSHAIATLALVRARRTGFSSLLAGPSHRAVEFLVDARSQTTGGWRYRPGEDASDTAVTAWCVLVLAEARQCDLPVPDAALTGAEGWFQSVHNETSGRYGYLSSADRGARLRNVVSRFPPREATSAAAAVSLYLIDPARNPTDLRRVVSLVSCDVPHWSPETGAIDLLGWLQGIRLLRIARAPALSSWRGSLRSALTDGQEPKGHAAGSWDPAADPWGSVGGRVYTTAVALMAIEESLLPQRPRG